MANNITEKGAQAAAIKAQKRAAALRENLKRRKSSEAERDNKGEKNAKPENRE
jgi:hypothetical protein